MRDASTSDAPLTIPSRSTNGHAANGHVHPSLRSPSVGEVTQAAQRSGFSVRLDGESLGDLVQLECLGRSNRAIRVTSTRGAGILYFHNGQIVHAATSRKTGEAAAAEILGWSQGVFEACEGSWPEQPSIQLPWQELLLRAAQVSDETGRPPAVANVGSADAKSIESATRRSAAVSAPRESSVSEKPAPVSMSQVVGAVRLSAAGDMISTRGEGEDLIGLASYVMRLGELTGGALGIGRMEALEVSTAGRHYVIYAETDGNIVAVEGLASAELSTVRKKAGL
jgi:hypothetical protein